MYDTAIEMSKRMLVDSIWKSANLEGLGTTFPKQKQFLQMLLRLQKRRKYYLLSI